MPTNSTIALTTTDYLLQNLGYLFFINRLMRRLGHADASALTGVCERTIQDLEGGDKQNIQFDNLIKMADAYGYKPSQVFLDYDSLPSPKEWKELKDKSIELGNLSRCKDYPLPGTYAGKELSKEWAEWGEPLLKRFYERGRK